MNNTTQTMMLVGVGGQGTLLASRILGNLLIDAGHDVKLSEVHGMSQRGGSVVTYIRYGANVASPIAGQGEADVIVAFELCEAARWTNHLKKDGILIVNNQKILPMPVITGVAIYPENIPEQLAVVCQNPIILDALSSAVEAGNSKSVNVVLLGVLSTILDFDLASWEKALVNSIAPKLLAMNQKAFHLGRDLVNQ